MHCVILIVSLTTLKQSHVQPVPDTPFSYLHNMFITYAQKTRPCMQTNSQEFTHAQPHTKTN